MRTAHKEVPRSSAPRRRIIDTTARDAPRATPVPLPTPATHVPGTWYAHLGFKRTRANVPRFDLDPRTWLVELLEIRGDQALISAPYFTRATGPIEAPLELLATVDDERLSEDERKRLAGCDTAGPHDVLILL